MGWRSEIWVEKDLSGLQRNRPSREVVKGRLSWRSWLSRLSSRSAIRSEGVVQKASIENTGYWSQGCSDLAGILAQLLAQLGDFGEVTSPHLASVSCSTKWGTIVACIFESNCENQMRYWMQNCLPHCLTMNAPQILVSVSTDKLEMVGRGLGGW